MHFSAPQGIATCREQTIPSQEAKLEIHAKFSIQLHGKESRKEKQNAFL